MSNDPEVVQVHESASPPVLGDGFGRAMYINYRSFIRPIRYVLTS